MSRGAGHLSVPPVLGQNAFDEYQDYKGYAIVAMATPAGSGKYHSIFSVQSAGQSEKTDHDCLPIKRTSLKPRLHY